MDGHSLFQKTYERAARLSDPDGIFVVTNEIHQYLVRNQIEELGYTISDDHLLAEPEGKTPCLPSAWAMQRIRAVIPLHIAVVFPSDHILGDSALDQIRAAEPLARKYLVTFGIKPTSPHTGYGYIKPGKALSMGGYCRGIQRKTR
ncbi:MAG: sugar phosphate nucleotidyltransferase [Ignavibacteriales bacterium]|nr:sugar phosphate nucleotidyltransferase [Ignavibacteriales bacterium]